MNDLEFSFHSIAEAEAFGNAYVADEPGAYFTVDRHPNNRFYVNFFEKDGYQINRAAPRIVCTSTVSAPRPMSHPHLG